MKEISRIVGSVLLVVGSVCAQNLVEYTNIPAKPATSPTAAAKLQSMGSEKIAGQSAEQSPEFNKIVTPEGTPDTMRAVPMAPAVFILSNGDRLESSQYLVTFDSLKVQQGGTQRTIPRSAVNWNATLAANHQRGVELKLPNNRYQVTIGF